MNEKSCDENHLDISLDVASNTDRSSKTSSTGQTLVHKHTLRAARLVSAESELLLTENQGADATQMTWDGPACGPHTCDTVDETPFQHSNSDLSSLTDMSIKGQVYNSSQRRLWYHARSIRKKQRLLRQMRARKTRVRRIWLSALATLLILCVSNAVGISFRYYQSVLPRLQDIVNKQIEQSTRIYDRSGDLLYTLYDPRQGRSTPISYAQIPGVLQDAQIAAEDKTFWTNTGVDVNAIIRSALVDLVARQVESGASTLTQQVIKNLSRDSDPSLQRKLNEAALAIGLTRAYPKWKILEMYFNVASYGAQELGVEAAVQDYFGLKAQCTLHYSCVPATAFLDRNLTHCTTPSNEATCQVDPLLALARASLLAGIPQNPVNFDPTLSPGNITALLARQDYVLKQMLNAHLHINLGAGSQTQDRGPVTAETVRQVEALSKHMRFVGFQNTIKAPHFVWWVIHQLANTLGNDQQIDPRTGLSIPGLHVLLTGGFTIRTTLDLRLEDYVEQATVYHLNQPEKQKLSGQTLILSKDRNIHDAATVVMDAHSGEILAMNGSANWTENDPRIEGELNAALTPRQPASTFKPIVIAAAFEMGWYPGIALQDTRTYFPIGAPRQQAVSSYNTYEPTDYGDTYSWRATNIDFAISNSLNVPAVKAYMFAGQQNVERMAQRLGITTITTKQVNPTIALGTAEVPLLQMVGAYQVFANRGVRVPPQSILSISDNYGHLFYSYDPARGPGTQVISPQIASLLTSILSDEPARAYEFHQDHDLSLWDWTLPDGTHPDVAAKTGTSDNFKDNWTIGYTPDLVVGVWAGNANGAPASGNSIGLTGAAPLWHSVIEYASGHCNQAEDHIPCPPSDFVPAHVHFSVPPGLAYQQVNTRTGLAGSGYRSVMIQGEQPMQSA
jgi:membrane peptidoglycan carboxypeptidase